MDWGNAMDLGDRFEKALSAARRGDLGGLEAELARLRTLPVEGVASVGVTLRAIARSVRAHPSFRQMPAAEAV